jgi:uroporphyrinogen decarboxylase
MTGSRVLNNFSRAVSLEEPEEVPTVIWSVALWYPRRLGIKMRDYYQGMDLKLDTQVKLQNQYPETMLLPGIWPDFGVAAEPSAFGCPVLWAEDEAPAARPAITNMKQVLSMKPIDVKTAGLLPRVLETHEFFLKHIDRGYIEAYGYLDGSVFFLGPLETAALIRGYGDFLMELIDNPKLVHKLLDLVTQTLLEWLSYLETRIGTLKRLLLCDHFPGQISPNHFEEYFFPYVKRIFDEYPNAIKLYHNEGPLEHMLQRIADLGPQIFHFGTDAEKTKEAIGDRVCLMGNLDPVRVMQNGTPESVRKEALEVLRVAAPGGGFILTSAGAFGVNTPEENVEAMLNAASTKGQEISNG